MTLLTDAQRQALLEAADTAAERAYAPYSHFHVGAALLTEDGSIVAGCNVENVSYPLSVCAERTAVANAIVQGHKGFTAVAIVQGNAQVGHEEPCWPCGGCRQVLSEFNPELTVLFREAGGVRETSLRELLPYSFDRTRLQVR